jgi:hypothetical protein
LLEKTAAQLSVDYGFKADTTDHFNFGGRNERWFKSRSGDWYYITPNGVVSKWDRNSGGALGIARGSQIARLSGNYYVNLNLLFQPVKTELVTQGGETITMNFAQATLLDTVFASIASSIT